MADTYEVEVKSLLGSQEAANRLRDRLRARDPHCVLQSSSTQLNHYFIDGDIEALVRILSPLVSADTVSKMTRIAQDGKSISIRSREVDGAVRIVMKASVGDDSSANGVARIEVEEVIPQLSLEKLDAKIQEAGYHYQAKWSRAREEYTTGPIAVCLDKNAGYGYVAEFEQVVPDVARIADARRAIDALMQELEVEELSQDRLERMFAHYNTHWKEYYGTDKIFIIN